MEATATPTTNQNLKPVEIDACSNLTEEQTAEQCPVLKALAVIGGKWKLQILWSLGQGPLRYSQLRRRLTGISEKMLIQQLKNLEKEGLVVRKMYPEVPPRVEYELNQASRDLMVVLSQLKEWWVLHHKNVDSIDNKGNLNEQI